MGLEKKLSGCGRLFLSFLSLKVIGFGCLGALLAVRNIHAAVSIRIPSPLTTQGISDFLDHTKKPVTMADFLGALPDSHRDNVVFVHRSHSLHKSSPEFPRQIIFGNDARFLLAISALPEDSENDVAEFAEYNDHTGTYHFGTIDFDPELEKPALNLNPRLCNTCHTSTPRPIWGSYHQWPGVYGGDDNPDERIRGDLSSKFLAFADRLPDEPKYRHLNFIAKSLPGVAVFELVDRSFPLPLTSFSDELTTRVSLGTFHRLSQDPRFSQLRSLLLATSKAMKDCSTSPSGPAIRDFIFSLYQDDTSHRPEFRRRYGSKSDDAIALKTMVYRLLGIDPGPELDLSKLGAQKKDPSVQWGTDTTHLDDLITLQLLEALQTDAVVEKTFQPAWNSINQMLSYFRLQGEARRQAERQPGFIQQVTGKRMQSEVWEPSLGISSAPSRKKLPSYDLLCQRLYEMAVSPQSSKPRKAAIP